MTEAQWLACDDPERMLHALHDKASERRLLLFACACCRLVWHLLPASLHQRVEVAERYAEREASHGDLMASFRFADHWIANAALPGVPGGAQAAEAVGNLRFWHRWYTPTPGGGDLNTASRVARSAAEALAKSMPWREARQLECQLLHDISGPPALRPVAPDPGWVEWNGGAAAKLAKAAYADRAFDCLPILADALEDAGCSDAELLGHLRSAGPHVRGCWALDLVLGKR